MLFWPESNPMEVLTISSFLKRSLELQNYHIENRRFLHQHPELGTQLPKTMEYVEEKLRELGCEVERVPGGLTAVIGSAKGKTILLRADMDALPMQEQSGLAFASQTPGQAHTCGHDLHTAFLLGAARMLRERERELKGAVKLMFQGGEETLEGAVRMLDAGVLENPEVCAAIGIHVQPLLPLYHLNYTKGAFLASTDLFQIQINGRGCHGAQPHLGVDPINVAAHVLLALQSLQVKEVPPASSVVINICQVQAGVASNVVPEAAVLTGTLRTDDNALREKLKKRMEQIAKGTAEIFGATAELSFPESCPCTENNAALVDDMARHLTELGAEFHTDTEYRMQVSDDFGFISCRVPSVMFVIGCKPNGEETSHNHNPRVVYNEDVLALGAAVLAHCAFCWVNE